MTRRWISDESWKKQYEKGCAVFETFSTDGPSDFLVGQSFARGRAPKEAERTVGGQNLSASSSERQWQEGLEELRGWMELAGKKGSRGQWKITWEKRLNTIVDIEALERLMEPENEEVSLRYILKYSTRGGSNIFQLLGHKIEKGPFRGKQKACGWSTKERG